MVLDGSGNPQHLAEVLKQVGMCISVHQSGVCELVRGNGDGNLLLSRAWNRHLRFWRPVMMCVGCTSLGWFVATAAAVHSPAASGGGADC